MHWNTKRTAAAAAAVALALAGGGVAYAYWTAGGSGTGTAATASGLVALTAVQTSLVTDLQPGGAAQALSGTFTNPNDGPVYVTDVTASIASVTKSGAVAVGCGASDYTLTAPVMAVGAEVLANDTSTWGGATIQFNNKATNQDACKGATVNLAYAIA